MFAFDVRRVPLFAVSVLLLCWSPGINAQQDVLLPYQEYDKRIRTAEQIGPLKSDLFGEQVNLSDRHASFEHVDIDLPGNNALPVQLRRRLNVRPKHMYAINPSPYGGVGDWDIEVPYITGTFDSAYGWNVGTSGQQPRCSSNFGPRTDSPFRIQDIWSGNSVHIPGRGSNEILAYPDSAHHPPDGQTHLWTTRELDSFSCVPMTSGYEGEGFVLLTREGVKYTFDIGTTRNGGPMGRSGDATRRNRVQVFLLASRIEDRFGNWVTYAYNADGHPTRIDASDGRRIDLAYSNGRLSTATAHGRQWSYQYTDGRLGSVNLPDESQWAFEFDGSMEINYGTWDIPMGPNCTSSPPVQPAQLELTITHPSGAVGAFEFSHGRHYRSGVPQSTCVLDTPQSGDQPATYYMAAPRYFDGFHLTLKVLSGAGLEAPMQWTYEDDGLSYAYDDGDLSKIVTITQPDGSKRQEIHGVHYALNEGRLLGARTLSPSGTMLESEALDYLAEEDVASQPFPDLYGLMYGGSGPATNRIRPVRTRTITRQGVDFIWHANTFDVFARPVSVTKEGVGGNSRNEVTAYHDNLSKWVLDQQASLIVNGITSSETSYDANALPTISKNFGRTIQTLGYDTASSISGGQRGTVRAVEDGNGNVTTLTDWKRGIPQSIGHPATPEAPSGATQSAVVNDHGWVTRVTDENGYQTNYQYDAGGRLSRISHPAGDNVAWNPTTFTFNKATSSAYGIPAGHWQHIATTGSGRKITYLDALWRPLLVREYDADNATGTQRFVRQSFDHDGRVVFLSYPDADGTPTNGIWTEYDALGRQTSVSHDSELGVLTTITAYLSGFQTRVTSPGGEQTSTAYLAWDEPTTEYPVSISHPEQTYTDIVRDVFGKPLSITRRDASGSMSLSRHYVYDAHQQLCKSVEPETRATIMAYDGAGNLAWSKTGAAQTGTGDCSTSDIPLVERTVHAYDARNRIAALVFPDNLGNTTYDYAPDGLLEQIVVDNGGADIVSTAYTYNRRRLVTGEAVVVGGHQWGIGYGYDANGHLATHVLPGGLTVEYAPNALGQPTQAGAYATDVSYFPNGAISQFSYGNQIDHSLTQNARGLPERSRDANGAMAVYDESLDYDQHGNVAAISDGLVGYRGDRTMSYDGLDRLTQTVSPMFGTASYTYDALDNLRTVRLTAGAKQRDHTYLYDANNRLNLVANTAGGATVMTLAYDAQGNLSSRDGQAYDFDQGNRLREVPGVERYLYDGHGRRVRAERSGGSIYSVYGQDGMLRYQHDERAGQTIKYVYLNGNLVARLRDPIALATPVLTVPGYSATGSYTASWTDAAMAMRYELQEQANDDGWRTIHDAAATNMVITDRPAGGYGYRVRACNAIACGSWSAVSATTVQLPPTEVPTLSVPATGLSGNYTVNWSSVAAADAYQLQEREGSGGWSTIQTGAGTARELTGKAAGNWSYRVRACNDAGCGGYSAVGAVEVIHPPGGAPTLTAPATSLTGSYSVSWTALAGSTRYELQERLDSGSWSTIHNAAANNVSRGDRSTGTWGYRVRACNEAGCAVYSAVATTTVLRSPAAAPTLTIPATNTSGSYAVSWSAVATASRYQLQERLDSGSWSTIHDAAATSASVSGKSTGAWSYRVRACNDAGCGGWSDTGLVAVTRPPATPTINFSRKNQHYVGTLIQIQCEVRWTATDSAQTYDLQAYGGVVQYSGPETTVRGNYNTSTYCGNSHVVRACNDAGCSAWSSPPYPQELVEYGTPGNPGDPPVIPAGAEGEGA